MSELEIVTVLAECWSDWQDSEDFPFNSDHCINGSRVAIETLRRLGIKAKPVSVQFVLLNAAAYQLHQRGVPGHDWPVHAWSVGVGPRGGARAGRFHGHLVVEGAGWTLDISARQFHRPHLIDVPEPIVLDANLPPAPAWAHFSHQRDCVLAMTRWPANNEWRQAPGWKRLHAAETDELTRRVQRVLNQGTP